MRRLIMINFRQVNPPPLDIYAYSTKKLTVIIQLCTNVQIKLTLALKSKLSNLDKQFKF